MAERASRREAWSYFEHVLKNAESVEKGEMACLDTASGELVKGQAATTLIPIGTFEVSMVGNGTALARVRLYREVELHWWDNDDSPNNVASADVGKSVYIKDDRTVSTLGTGRSIAGRAWAVSARYGVLVEAGLGVIGPTGASGTMGSVADRTALAAVGATSRYDGATVLVRTDGSMWRFVAASTAVEDEALDLVIEPDAGTGRWVRADKAFTIKAPIAHTTADNAVILTVPAGFVLRLASLPYYEVTTAFTGGSSSAIGIDSNVTGYTTKGDLLGGASGNVAAALTAGIRPGTVGTALDTFAELQAFILQPTNEIHFGRITSAFTAGAGFVCLPVVAMTPA
jgi:hypothetical protein